MENMRCYACRNYMGDLTCQAFPKGIPKSILVDENGHSNPLPDQGNNIVFEPKKESK